MSVEHLRVLAARVRAEAEAAGELAPVTSGDFRWALPEGAREALLADIRSGAFVENVRAVSTGDPDLT